MSLYVKRMGKIFGPFTREDVSNCLTQGLFTPGNHISEDRMEWIPLSEYQQRLKAAEDASRGAGISLKTAAPVLKPVAQPIRPVGVAQPIRPVGVAQPVAQPVMAPPPPRPVMAPPPPRPVMAQPGGMGFAPQVPYGYKPKDHLTYILLGAFLGGFGIHNFYAGYTGKAVAQLLMTLLSCGWLGLIVLAWVIVEICTVKTDARGVPFA